MLGKRQIQEYGVTDDYNYQVILIISLDDPSKPTYVGAYGMNRFTGESYGLLSIEYVIEMNECGMLNSERAYQCYDVCLN